MAQAEDPVNPSNRETPDPDAPRFLDGEGRAGAPPPDKEARRASRPRIADYAKASPEDIAADIERTRARMDETLLLLSRKLRPRYPGKAALAVIGLAAFAALAALGWAGFRGYRLRHSLRGRLAGTSRKGLRRVGSMGRSWLSWRRAGIGEQSLLAARLALAVRKGKPAVIVVEPRAI